jgi:rhodanese-related sulfurtransferase
VRCQYTGETLAAAPAIDRAVRVAGTAAERDNARPVHLLRQSLRLAVAGIMFGLLVNALRSDGVALLRPFAPEAEGAAECVAGSAPVRISIAEAERLLRAREAVFGDVRDAAEYAAGHVVDAVHLPCSADAPDWLATVGKASTVVVYGAEDDSDADPVAQSLSANGYRDVRVLSGGFPAWRAGGGSAASGPCQVCN